MFISRARKFKRQRDAVERVRDGKQDAPVSYRRVSNQELFEQIGYKPKRVDN